MDAANAAAESIPTDRLAGDRPSIGDPPSIGVPSIPGDREPAPVPSLPVPPESNHSAPVPLARVPPAGGTSLGAGPPPANDPVPDPVDLGFTPGVSSKLGTYVYLLVDPRTGRAFYVGRGRNDRCFRHLAAARATDRPSKFPMLERIREIESGGRTVRVDILRYGMSPTEALTVEAAVHEALGLPDEPTLGNQRRAAIVLNSLLAKQAKFKRGHQLVLLRIGDAGSDPSYDSARHGWPIGRRWTDLDSRSSPRWAALVVADLVAAVYRIHRWEQDRAHGCRHRPGEAGSSTDEQFSFVGAPDPELEERYLGRTVAAYREGRDQSPVTFVWCGPGWVSAPW